MGRISGCLRRGRRVVNCICTQLDDNRRRNLIFTGAGPARSRASARAAAVRLELRRAVVLAGGHRRLLLCLQRGERPAAPRARHYLRRRLGVAQTACVAALGPQFRRPRFDMRRLASLWPPHISRWPPLPNPTPPRRRPAAYVTVALSIQDLNGALALAGSIKKWEAARRRRVATTHRRRRRRRRRGGAVVASRGRATTRRAATSRCSRRCWRWRGTRWGASSPWGAPAARPQAAAYCTALPPLGSRSTGRCSTPRTLVAAESAPLFDRRDHLTSGHGRRAGHGAAVALQHEGLLLRPSAERHRALRNWRATARRPA